MGEVIAILSGKGGAGKTTVCAALATALAQTENSVLCVDCDAGMRSLDIYLGIREMDALSFTDVCCGGYELSQAAVHPEWEDLRFLTAPVNQTWQNIDEKAFEKFLNKARKKFRYILLDCPPGLGKCFTAAAGLADQCILVTQADPSSVRGAVRAAEELEKSEMRQVRLVVNRVDSRRFGKMKLTVDDIMDETGVGLLGLVPEDDSVFTAVCAGKNLMSVTKKGAAAACRRIANRLQGKSEPIGI